MRICLDELYTPLIAAQLRRRGHAVISVHDRAALLGTPDAELLASMSAERRAIVTANVADVMILASRLTVEGTAHYGLLFTSDTAMPRSRNTVGIYVRTLDRYLRDRPQEDALRDAIDWLRPLRGHG